MSLLMTQRYCSKIMRYLIDTNILIYAIAEPDLLSSDVAAITEHLPLISSDTRFEFYRNQGLDLIFNKK